jgi:hypothetical protein
VREVERVRRHESGHDPHVLDAGQQQDRPQLVEELRREDRRAEGGARARPLGGERDAVVAEEHWGAVSW